MSRRHRTEGFTLLELLMVVIIIAILASLAMPQFIKASEKARAAEALQALSAIRTAEMRYRAFDASGTYTNNVALLDVGVGTNGVLPLWNALNITVAGSGNAAVGTAVYTRGGGIYSGQDVGIQFGSGTICGNFAPMGLTTGSCTAD